MRDTGPMRRRGWLALSGSALVLATVVAGIGWYDFDAPGAPGELASASILALLMFGGIFLACMGGMELFEARRFDRMARGEGVIARWHVDVEDWRQCMVKRRALDDARPDLRGSFHVMHGDPSPAGVDIVVSEDAVFVGPEAMHPLFKEFGNRAQLQDGWLELTSRADDSDFVLRLPVTPGAEAEAGKVVRYFRLLDD
jgi:hypothetical protein